MLPVFQCLGGREAVQVVRTPLSPKYSKQVVNNEAMPLRTVVTGPMLYAVYTTASGLFSGGFVVWFSYVCTGIFIQGAILPPCVSISRQQAVSGLQSDRHMGVLLTVMSYPCRRDLLLYSIALRDGRLCTAFVDPGRLCYE